MTLYTESSPFSDAMGAHPQPDKGQSKGCLTD